MYWCSHIKIAVAWGFLDQKRSSLFTQQGWLLWWVVEPLWTASVFCPSALPSDSCDASEYRWFTPGLVTVYTENVDCPTLPAPRWLYGLVPILSLASYWTFSCWKNTSQSGTNLSKKPSFCCHHQMILLIFHVINAFVSYFQGEQNFIYLAFEAPTRHHSGCSAPCRVGAQRNTGTSLKLY